MIDVSDPTAAAAAVVMFALLGLIVGVAGSSERALGLTARKRILFSAAIGAGGAVLILAALAILL